MERNDAVSLVTVSLAVGVVATFGFTLLSHPPTERLGISSYGIDSVMWFWFPPLLFGTIAGGLFLRMRLVTPLVLLVVGLFAYGLWPTEFAPVLPHFYILSAGGTNLLLAAASGEYIARRATGYLSQPLLPTTERALLVGLIGGGLSVLVYGFSVFDLTENLSPIAGATEPVLYHVVSGPMSTVGQFCLVLSPLLFSSVSDWLHRLCYPHLTCFCLSGIHKQATSAAHLGCSFGRSTSFSASRSAGWSPVCVELLIGRGSRGFTNSTRNDRDDTFAPRTYHSERPDGRFGA